MFETGSLGGGVKSEKGAVGGAGSLGGGGGKSEEGAVGGSGYLGGGGGG